MNKHFILIIKFIILSSACHCQTISMQDLIGNWMHYGKSQPLEKIDSLTFIKTDSPEKGYFSHLHLSIDNNYSSVFSYTYGFFEENIGQRLVGNGIWNYDNITKVLELADASYKIPFRFLLLSKDRNTLVFIKKE